MNELMRRRRALMAAGGGTVHGTWEDLFRHLDIGDYSSAYQAGETIPLDLGSTLGVINMEISNFDHDVLASDTSQRAKVSLVAKELLAETHRWNPAFAGTDPPFEEGTGTIGGWAKCELRTWMAENVLPAIPASVSARIVSVAKYSFAYLPDGTTSKTILSEDKVYIPSQRECGRDGWEEGRATTYAALNSADKRIKHKVGASTNALWWTRSFTYNSKEKALCVSTYGQYNQTVGNVSTTSTVPGICLCFCLS